VSIRSKRSPPQDKKTVPKSAFKTRKGFVKDSRDSKGDEVTTAGDDVKEETIFAAKCTNTAGLTAGEPFDRSSFDSINAGETPSDSSYVSETTDYDPFNSLLGKLTSDDDDNSSSSEENEGGEEQRGESDKENMHSPSKHLPFKVSTLVKPTEINLRKENLPSPAPQHARSWRELAAKAALEKGQSTRFRSEKSWQKLAAKSP